MKRPLRPRATAALSVAPATVTDRSAPAVLGLEPRAFRDLLARFGVRHTTIGRRVIATVADVLEALERAGTTGETPSVEPVDHDGGDGVDGVLRKLGRTRRTA